MHGLKHPTHPLHVNKTDVLTTFDFIFRKVTKDFKNEKQEVVNLKQSYQTWPIVTLTTTDRQSML